MPTIRRQKGLWDLRHTWFVKWLGISSIPLLVAAVLLWLGLGPWLIGPEVRPPNVRGEPGTLLMCPSFMNEGAYEEMEGSTDPFHVACLDEREELVALRSLLTRVGVGFAAAGLVILMGTLAVRSSREHRRLELELARRLAESNVSDEPAASETVGHDHH